MLTFLFSPTMTKRCQEDKSQLQSSMYLSSIWLIVMVNWILSLPRVVLRYNLLPRLDAKYWPSQFYAHSLSGGKMESWFLIRTFSTDNYYYYYLFWIHSFSTTQVTRNQKIRNIYLVGCRIVKSQILNLKLNLKYSKA